VATKVYARASAEQFSEGQSIMSGRARARALVEDICKGHGYIPPEILDRISKVDRDIVVQAMRTKDELIASSVTTYDPVP
jgi:hypothetical protein